MKSLTRFESNLNQILRCLLGRMPLAAGLPLMLREVAAPRCLSRDCVDLVQDTLAKGFTQRMAHAGAQDERFLVDGNPVAGRVWQRKQPNELGLSFSHNTMRILIWLTSQNAATSRSLGGVRPDQLTVADHLFNLTMFETVQSTLIAPNLLMKPAIRDNAFIWLYYPDRIVEETADDQVPGCSADFSFWFTPENSWILESLQTRIVEQLHDIELAKRRSADPTFVQRVGEVQAHVLSKFTKAANAAGRRDLTWFMLSAADQLLSATPAKSHATWLERLNVDGLRLADRALVYRSALALFHSLEQLNQWQQEALAVGFYDDDYQTSQFWKSEWETRNGNDVCFRSEQLIRSIEVLRT